MPPVSKATWVRIKRKEKPCIFLCRNPAFLFAETLHCYLPFTTLQIWAKRKQENKVNNKK
jgi:hypothetical protein